MVAVERRADEAVLGEAPEELSFTLGDLDRRVNFLAPTTGGCTDERHRRGTKRAVSRLSKARLAEMIEEATVDAYGEYEQTTGWFTMIDQTLAVPFETTVLGVPVTVERIDLNASEQIVAVCRRGRNRQALPILDLPMPSPPPEGAEWIEAYRQWRVDG
jgi:hypothetical protein